MGIIRIKNLELSTFIGVPEVERSAKQSVWVSLDIDVADPVEDRMTLDYAALHAAIKMLEDRSRQTMEGLALEVEQIVKSFGAEKYRIKITKKILPDTESTSFVLIR